MEEITFTIRQAIPSDAKELLRVLKTIGGETSFLVMDEKGIGFSEEEMQDNLDRLYYSPNNVMMLALVDGKIVGNASIKASFMQRMEHIGEIGISILNDYWGFGLGSLLMEELIQWAQEGQRIRRLELTVQKRNQRAIHVYEKIGFQTEAVMARGAKTDEGQFLDVCLMSLLID